MNRILLHCFLIAVFNFVYTEEPWKLDEQRVYQTAQRENLPIAALFLAEGKCPWSQKLSQDVLSNAHFQNQIRAHAILWAPAQSQPLQQKYEIKEYPQVLLLDPQGKEFARFGYLPLDAAGYVDAVACLTQNFQDVCIAMEQEEGTIDEEQWINLYLKAKTLSAPYFKQVILEQGLKKEKGNFFHLEKLKGAFEKHKLKNPQVVKLKSELLKRDPDNKWGTHFKVALLEFQKATSRKSKGRPEKVIKPLLRYIQTQGKRDAENLWKAEVAIAEFLFEKKALTSALEHIQAAYEAAPEAMKPLVAETLLYMQKD